MALDYIPIVMCSITYVGCSTYMHIYIYPIFNGFIPFFNVRYVTFVVENGLADAGIIVPFCAILYA